MRHLFSDRKMGKSETGLEGNLVTAHEISNNIISKTEQTMDMERNSKVSALIERVYMFLEDEKWDEADSYCEKVLDIEPKNAEAYLGKLLSGLEIKSIKNLELHKVSFRENEYYKKICKFAEEPLLSDINTILNKVELEEKYNSLKSELYFCEDINKYDSESKLEALKENYENISERFMEIGDYKDSKQLYEDCISRVKKIEDRIKSITLMEKEKQRISLIINQLDKEIDDFYDDVFAYKVGYMEYASVKKSKKDNESRFLSTIELLEQIIERLRNLTAKTTELNTLMQEKKALGLFSVSRKKELNSELTDKQNEINMIKQEMNEIQKKIPNGVCDNLNIEDIDDITSHLNGLRQEVNLYKSECPELEKINIDFSKEGIIEDINAIDLLDAEKILRYLLASIKEK